MKTPLIFKLLLMLALGFRLMKSAKKEQAVPKFEQYLDLNKLESKPYDYIASEEITVVEKIKRAYRDNVRNVPSSEMTLQMQIIYVADSFLRAFSKKGVFRFLWHRNDLVFAFYQSLKFINMEELAHTYEKLLLDYTKVDLRVFDPKKAKEHELFPDANIESPHLAIFDQLFNPEDYSKAVLSYVQQKS